MIYFIQNVETGHIKIGYAASPEKRLNGLQTGSPHELKLLHSIPGTPADEATLHKKFQQHRLRGEWFEACGEILSYIEEARKPTQVDGSGGNYSREADSLVSKWFHSKDEAQRIKWQGQILSKVTDGIYVVQLYSWLDGLPSCQKLVSVKDMLDWSFFENDEQMRFAWENELKVISRHKREHPCPAA
jgi:hypothetical protein